MITLEQFQEDALSTIKPHDSKELAIADWSLGLGGEMAEVSELIQNHSLDKMELAKELGDVLWYVVAVAKELDLALPIDLFRTCREHTQNNMRFSFRESADPKKIIVELHILIGTIQEHMKHRLMHKEDLDYEPLTSSLIRITARIEVIADFFGFSIYEVAELNNAKLNHRYNGKQYSTEASVNRHEAEYKFEDTEIFQALKRRIEND